jgi:hypothetical protein
MHVAAPRVSVDAALFSSRDTAAWNTFSPSGGAACCCGCGCGCGCGCCCGCSVAALWRCLLARHTATARARRGVGRNAQCVGRGGPVWERVLQWAMDGGAGRVQEAEGRLVS